MIRVECIYWAGRPSRHCLVCFHYEGSDVPELEWVPVEDYLAFPVECRVLRWDTTHDAA